MGAPHPRLLPLLRKYALDWSSFSKKGRPPQGVREKRALIVTELHEGGCTWAEVMEITGLSNGAIQRLTRAKGCKAVRDRRALQGAVVGSSWKGRSRKGQLEKQWASGDFDHLRGRSRSEDERESLREGWTPEKRSLAGARSRSRIWADLVIRGRLLAFHRSPSERKRRSQDQVRRMIENPGRYLRGKSEWVPTPKGASGQAFVRSSYEKMAVSILEADKTVVRYEHERRVRLTDGSWILPDFIVEYRDGSVTLIEVKANWVFNLPLGHRVHQRLRLSKELAQIHGWDFSVWTEQELEDALSATA